MNFDNCGESLTDQVLIGKCFQINMVKQDGDHSKHILTSASLWIMQAVLFPTYLICLLLSLSSIVIDILFCIIFIALIVVLLC